jgi:DNA-binding response OmpR family regulator
MSPVPPILALVVDDDALIRQAMVRALTQVGMTCEVAADGEQAWEMLCTSTYDIVICDLRMPTMNGHQLIVAILTMKDRPAIMVVTGLPDPRIMRDLFIRGVEDIMAKPVNFDVLALKANALAKRRQVTAVDDTDVTEPASSDSEHLGQEMPGNASVDTAQLSAQRNESGQESRDMEQDEKSRPIIAEGYVESVASKYPSDNEMVRKSVPNRERRARTATSADEYGSTVDIDDECERVSEQIRNLSHGMTPSPADFDGFRAASGDTVGMTELTRAIQMMPLISVEVLSLANNILFQSSEQLKRAERNQLQHKTPKLDAYRYTIGILLFLLGGFIGYTLASIL